MNSIILVELGPDPKLKATQVSTAPDTSLNFNLKIAQLDGVLLRKSTLLTVKNTKN
jgi:hypothetical protein